MSPSTPRCRVRGGRSRRLPPRSHQHQHPHRLSPPGSLEACALAAGASLKSWRGLRSREADSWKVPGKRPPPRPGGARGAGGGERGRRVGLGSRAHTRLRGQTVNSCQVSPPLRLAGLGLPPLKHEPFLPQPPTLRGSRTVRAGAPGARPQDPLRPEPGSLRQVPLAKPEGSARGTVAGEGGGVRAPERRTAWASAV